MTRHEDLSKTERLVEQVVAAGGTLMLPDETRRGGVNWRQRAYAAQRHGKVPDGKRLTASWNSEGFVICLRDGVTGNELGADPVPVPQRVTRYHRVAKEFRTRTSLHEVSRATLPRALRIVHALAAELERRGYEVTCVSARRDSYGRSEWRPKHDGQFLVTLNEHEFRLRIWEKGAGLRGVWEQQRQHYEEHRLDPYRLHVERPEPYDKNASGELNMAILGSGPRQSQWGDRQRWKLEDRLPQLVRELETQVIEAEERRQARELEEAERQRRWEAAMQRAEALLIEDYRAQVLAQRVRDWQQADAIRAYCDAVEARHGEEAVAKDSGAGRWLALAREHASRLQDLPAMPADPEITAEALKPFLGGLSPYGAGRGW